MTYRIIHAIDGRLVGDETDDIFVYAESRGMELSGFNNDPKSRAGCFLPLASQAQNMSIKSADVSDGAIIKDEQVFNGFGCTGGNISPSLTWSGVPNGTKSFAITVYNPDEAAGGTGLCSTFPPRSVRFLKTPAT